MPDGGPPAHPRGDPAPRGSGSARRVDLPLIGLLDNTGVSYQIVLTKADKAGACDLAAVLEGLSAELRHRRAAHPEIPLTSAINRRGIAELRASVADFAVAAEQ